MRMMIIECVEIATTAGLASRKSEVFQQGQMNYVNRSAQTAKEKSFMKHRLPTHRSYCHHSRDSADSTPEASRRFASCAHTNVYSSIREDI